jgi:hypothetical protein
VLFHYPHTTLSVVTLSHSHTACKKETRASSGYVNELDDMDYGHQSFLADNASSIVSESSSLIGATLERSGKNLDGIHVGITSTSQVIFTPFLTAIIAQLTNLPLTLLLR